MLIFSRHFLLLCLLSGLLWACSDRPDNKPSKQAKPNTPESVFRSWQAHIDRNEFKEARLLSTQSTVEWINIISTMLFEEADSAEVLLTHFKKMKCREEADTAVCSYIIDEDGLEIIDSVLLVRVKNQWLVDFAEEEDMNEEEAAEIRKEIQDMIDKANAETVKENSN